MKPRVYYLNVPKKFIAGTLYDPVEEEVVIGATAHPSRTPKSGAVPSPSRPTPTATSGSKDLEEGTYSLAIAADGFATRAYDSIDTAKDVNLGDIPLSR